MHSYNIDWPVGLVVGASGYKSEGLGFDSHSSQNICAMSICFVCALNIYVSVHLKCTSISTSSLVTIVQTLLIL